MRAEVWTGWHIRNLEKLRDAVARHGPEHFDMDWWFNDEGGPLTIEDVDTIDISRCGTTACMAGHAALLMGREDVEGDVFQGSDVARWLGIPSQGIFHVETWPLFVELHLDNSVNLSFEPASEHEDALALLDGIIAYAKEQTRRENDERPCV